jgi:FkbM family methyltransferase
MIRLTAAAALLRAGATLSLSEPELLGLSTYVRPGAVCFDIGAAYGMYTHPLAHLAGPTGQVHSFEPLPLPYRLLEAGVRASGARNVRITNAALGAALGWRTLQLPYRFGLPIHGWAHLEEGLKHSGKFAATKKLEVPLYSVDRVCELREIARVDFMKIDVEGFEAKVLEGAKWTIEQHRPTLLIEIEHVWHGHRWQRMDQVVARRRNYLFTAG